MSQSRRQFVKTTGLASVAALTGGSPEVRDSWTSTGATQAHRVVQTPVLDIGYEESGDEGGFPIILLHGFPYDVRAWDGVVPPLADSGHRVLVPYLRGYGTTRFRDPAAPRMAEQAAIGQDVIDFADALGLDRFALGGFDWGNRAACITAILHPDRVRAQVAIGGYSVQDTYTPSRPDPRIVWEERAWYHWYFNTPRGRWGLAENRSAICRYLWEKWSPGWDFSDEEFERTAKSFDNPDFVDVVIHSYRHRHGYAPGEERFLDIERRLAERPPIQVPAIVLRGAAGGFGRPSEDPSADRGRFRSLVNRRIVENAGHYLSRQRPETVSEAMLELLAM